MPVTLTQWTAHKRRQQNPLWPSAQVFWNDFAIVAVVCAGALSVNLVGSLPGDEIVVLILLPFLLASHGKRAFRREYLWFYILLAGWLIGTIGGDLYLGSSFANRLKGVARVVFLGLDFATITILINKKTREMIVFALSMAIVMMVTAQKWGDFATVWKYGGSEALTLPSLIVSSYFYARRRYSICILISLGLAVLNLNYAFRSQLAVDLTSCALILPLGFGSREFGRRGAPSGREILRIVLLLGLAGGAAYGADQVVKFAVSQHFFDESVEQKFEAQSAGKLGVMVGGRPETLVAMQAIIDSPIIGHGSFAVDARYLQLLQDIQYKYDYSASDEPEDIDVPGIPTHSHLTEAWVESGILGGIFWIYILILATRSLIKLIALHPSLAPLYSYLLVGFLWDVLYSPMGSVERLWGAYVILLSYDLLSPAKPKPVLSVRKVARPVYRKIIVSSSRGGR